MISTHIREPGLRLVRPGARTCKAVRGYQQPPRQVREQTRPQRRPRRSAALQAPVPHPYQVDACNIQSSRP
jgi:hypothetical protein